MEALSIRCQSCSMSMSMCNVIAHAYASCPCVSRPRVRVPSGTIGIRTHSTPHGCTQAKACHKARSRPCSLTTTSQRTRVVRAAHERRPALVHSLQRRERCMQPIDEPGPSTKPSKFEGEGEDARKQSSADRLCAAQAGARRAHLRCGSVSEPTRTRPRSNPRSLKRSAPRAPRRPRSPPPCSSCA